MSLLFVQFGGEIFQQTCGVPMGGNASPDIADLTLSIMEYRYITDCVKTRKPVPIGMRYIDDIIVTNYKNFLITAKNIYPDTLCLVQTNVQSSKAVFLDLEINIENGLKLNVYNKTDDFPFQVMRYGTSDSNIHSNTSYGTFYSQITRFLRITNSRSNFERRVSNMFQTFLTQGFERSPLTARFLRCIEANKTKFCMLGVLSNAEIAQMATRIFNREYAKGSFSQKAL